MRVTSASGRPPCPIARRHARPGRRRRPGAAGRQKGRQGPDRAPEAARGARRGRQAQAPQLQRRRARAERATGWSPAAESRTARYHIGSQALTSRLEGTAEARMGILDDAIREHLDLKRKHGARDPSCARSRTTPLAAGERPDPFAAGELFGETAPPRRARTRRSPDRYAAACRPRPRQAPRRGPDHVVGAAARPPGARPARSPAPRRGLPIPRGRASRRRRAARPAPSAAARRRPPRPRPSPRLRGPAGAASAAGRPSRPRAATRPSPAESRVARPT